MNQLKKIQNHVNHARELFNNSDLQEYDIPLGDFMSDKKIDFITKFSRAFIDRNNILHIISLNEYNIMHPRDFVFYNERYFPFENVEYHLVDDGYAYTRKYNGDFVLHNDTDPAFCTNYATFFCIRGKYFSPNQWKEYHNLSTEEITYLKLKYPNWR